MKRSDVERPSPLKGRVGQLALLAGLILVPAMMGCPGQLGPGFTPTGMTGTGGSGNSGTGGTTGAVCDAPTKYFKSTGEGGCALAAACHANDSGLSISGIDLVTDDGLWERLLNKPSVKGGGTCVGVNYVNSSKPATGMLLQRLAEKTPCTLMPFGQQAVNTELLECVTSWVNSKL